MENEIKQPMNGKGGINTLIVRVNYIKGGYSPFLPTKIEGGVYAVFSPAEIKDGLIATSILGDVETSGFKTLLKPMGRRNAKTVERIWNAVRGNAEKAAELFEQKRYREIEEMMLDSVKGI